MGHYKSNVRDIEFNLFEVLGTDALLGAPPFTDIDEDTARGMIAEVARLAEGPVGESFADGDRNPPVFDPETHSVTLPESIKRSFRALQQAEFWRLETSPDLGGEVAPGRSCGRWRNRFSGPIRPCTSTWPARPSPRSCMRLGTSSNA